MIDMEKYSFSINMMCRLSGVSRSGYYSWAQREPSNRVPKNIVLLEKIREVHKESRGTYGSPRIVKELKEGGFEVGRRRISRLMQENGITGLPPKRFKVTTDSKHSLAIADNVLNRDFNPDWPCWVKPFFWSSKEIV